VNPDRHALARRTIRVLLLSQILAGAGLAAGITVGALLAEDMIGSTGSAGVPAALFTLGAAGAAVLVGRVSQASGRRPGLAGGYAFGAIGGAGVVLAAAIDSVPLLFFSLVLYGSGFATNLQARYAGADLVDANRRGRAVSTVLVATTIGAVAGPNLVEVTGDVADAIGVNPLAGPFLLSTVAYTLAAIAVTALLRPDPLLAARRFAEQDAPADGAAIRREETDDRATVRLAASAMVITQTVMVSVMTMTPIHMRDHGHSLGAAGLVISIHIAGMYLPSPLGGLLADRVGRKATLACGSVSLLAATLLAATAPEDSVALLAVALGLLGVGWSLGLVAGSTMITDATPLARRAGAQGRVDVGVALAGAVGGISSGVVVQASSYATLAVVGGVLALALLPLLVAARERPVPATA
jgi:MFS family permease